MVSLQKFGRVYVLTLVGDGEHRLNGESATAIIEALRTVYNADDAGALVTTNEGRFFSNGLDLDYAKASGILSQVLAALVDMNVPTIAAVCGHAAAGGFIFALAHDHRCMSRARGYLYMSEMDVRVRIQPAILNVIRSSLNPKAFKDTVLLARKQTAAEALQAGIIDSVHENSAETLEAAIRWGTELSNRRWDRNFYRTMRLDMHPDLLKDLMNSGEPGFYYKQSPSKL